MVGDVENTRECIKPSIFGMESTTTAGIELIVGVVGGVAGLCGCLGTAIACLYKRATGKNINWGTLRHRAEVGDDAKGISSPLFSPLLVRGS